MPETVWRFFVFFMPGLWRWRSGLCVPMCVENFAKVFDG